MNKKLIALLVVIVALAAGGVFYFSRKTGEEYVFTPVQIKKGDLKVTVDATATVSPQNRLEIKSPVAGRIEEILVKEGDVLKRGDILAWTSSTERAALLDSVRTKGDKEFKRWQDLYKPTPVIAPINGTLILRSMETGQSFTSTDVIFTMADRLTVKTQVDETDIAQVKNGQRALITLDAYPQNPVKGKVVHVAYDSTVTNNVTTYVVDVLPDEVPEFMRSGMTANVNIVVQDKKDVLIVPLAAVTSNDEGKFVEVKQGEKITSIPIELGLDNGRMAEVVKGPIEGETIVIRSLALKGKQQAKNPFMPQGPRGGRGKR
ncbi:efflux RND transporter periplasmic adaptor subunit [Peredibacter starrii]|uniref:HlyD family efflux transporter periplasmic adaptor subunit n=1 Tax=Peredibacter starrii TaxID=28202 RepID=A0AAX4HK76_9BACT|nr:HlyD family efflux transporter periplasmic adaptor subunit [Peredibacter starrii]WPU63602.1 HlyD family efflux transporter periplasmic adaptor subunit [Peredibacter starrii]